MPNKLGSGKDELAQESMSSGTMRSHESRSSAKGKDAGYGPDKERPTH
jgi:hypothetical protein